MRGYWTNFRALLTVGIGAFALTGACGSDSDEKENPGSKEQNQCDACANDKCSSQNQACNDLSGCRSIRDCQYDCASTDTVCRANCVSVAASDTNAVLAAANLLACATTSCLNECYAGPQGVVPGGAGTSGLGAGGLGAGGLGAGGLGTGAGGAGSGAVSCDDIRAWATQCGLMSSDPIVAQCASLKPCELGCTAKATCLEYFEASQNKQNGYTNCLEACAKAAAGTGGAPNPSTSGGAPNMPTTPGNPNFVIAEGGYITTPTWHGYAWTATDGASASTITPADFTTHAAGAALCARGTVAGTDDYSAVAMLGFNLAQDRGVGSQSAPAPLPVSPSNLLDGGVEYTVSNRGGSPLRIQIQGPKGETDPSDRWCAEINQVGAIPWTGFNSECWEGGAGTAYGGSSLVSVMVLVPGDLTDRSFDFCIELLAES